jgi:hypothetical protein
VRSVRPVVPFRVFGFAARRRALPPRRRPLVEFTARSEFLARLRSAFYWFCAPAAPFALAPVVRFSAAGLRRSQLSDQRRPLFEFRVPPESSSAIPSRPAAAVQRLSWASRPYSTFRIRRSTCCERLPTPAMVRLQGLVTLLTAFARRIRVGLVSCRQRSWDSPFGVFPSQKVPGAFRPG